MPKNLKRHYGRGDLHFLTFSCYRRLPLLNGVQARNTFLRVLGTMRERHRFLLIGYVVMPEHVHLLVSESAKSSPSVVLKALKQCVSRELNNAGRLPHFWQPRFYDFNVWSSKKVEEKLEYMHNNPVKRGLVKSPGDWMWSSFSFYEKGESGFVTIDPVD